ncbi:MAG TPA: iron-containing alcohol dehydrogenase [Clostridia bacterium]|nr:iron-containing alcohol dehydrogenase [Clostridia bacterium]
MYKFYCRVYQGVFKIASSFLNWKKPELISGNESVGKVSDIVKSKGISKVLIVTGKTIMSLNLHKNLLDSLENNGIECFIYNGTRPNPTIENIEQAKQMYINNKCEAFIAFGGGSQMDCAKIAAARVVRPKRAVQDMRGLFKVGKKLPLFIAIPTTAGTGSETTIAAVVTNPETHEKYPINDLNLIPDYAILDPNLTIGLPPQLTATTGMDALTHAVEAYIGKSNTKETEENAEKAVKMIFANLENAYKDGNNIIAREQMLLASYYAGIAFTRAYVGYIHAIAHSLGGMYGISHGLANAVIMPHVLEYFGESAHKRLSKLSDCIGLTKGKSEKEKSEAFIAQIKAMNSAMNIPNKFDQIKQEDIPLLAQRAIKEGNPLYPVPKILNKKDFIKIIESLMA